MPELYFASLLREFVTLFVVIDPIGTLPVFYFATRGVPEALHWRLAIRAVAVAAVVLVLFLVAGQLVIEAIGLRLGSFQIAGGIVLFLFALTMIFGEPKSAREIEEAERDDHMAGAVFPLAMPSIASPGAMLAVVILTDNNRNSIPDQVVTGMLLMLVLLITLALLLLAPRVKRLIGQVGANVISRVMGLVLATVAVNAVLNGLEQVGVLSLG